MIRKLKCEIEICRILPKDFEILPIQDCVKLCVAIDWSQIADKNLVGMFFVKSRAALLKDSRDLPIQESTGVAWIQYLIDILNVGSG